jgi:hypothetical protein
MYQDSSIEQGGLFGDLVHAVTHPAAALRSAVHTLSHPKELLHVLGAVVDGPMDAINATIGKATGFTLPVPSRIVGPLAGAIASGDLSKMEGALVDLGHTVADVVAYVPGIGTGLAGALNTGLTILQTGVGLAAAVEPLLAIPPFAMLPVEVKDVIRGLVSALDHMIHGAGAGHALTDVMVAEMRKDLLSRVPVLLKGPVDELFKAIMHMVFHKKKLVAAGARLLHEGIARHPHREARHATIAHKAIIAEQAAHQLWSRLPQTPIRDGYGFAGLSITIL